MRHIRTQVLLLILMLIAPLFSASIWFNQPKLGENLEILVENASANASVTLRHPDGQTEVLALNDSQLSYPIHQSGRWEADVEGRQWSWTVTEPGDGAGNTPRLERSEAVALPFMVGAIALLVALAGMAVYFLIFKAPALQAPVLEKNRKNGNVRTLLRAGTRPLTHVRLEDEVGSGWAHAPRRLWRERLDAGQALEIEYAWSGDMGDACARFEWNSKRCELRVSEGRAALEAQGEEDAGDETQEKQTAGQRPGTSPVLRRLRRER